MEEMNARNMIRGKKLYDQIDACELVKLHGHPEIIKDGDHYKCEGFQRGAEDDEPCEKCKACPLCAYAEEEDIKEKWAYAPDPDGTWSYFEFSTKEEAELEAREAMKEYGYDKMYIGRGEPIPLPLDCNVDNILENLDDQYHDEAPGFEDHLFEGVSREDERWLETELSKVMRMFYQRIKLESSWYNITETYLIYPEDPESGADGQRERGDAEGD